MTPSSSTAVDCSRNSPDQYSDACEEAGNAAIGIFVAVFLVASVLLLALMWWGHRRFEARAATDD